MQRTIIQDFVATNVDLIYSLTTPGTLITKEMVSNIPIVFSIVTFPAEAGVVGGMASSGNNLVGTSNWIPVDKQLLALLSVAPDIKTIGFVRRAGEPNSAIQLERMRRAGRDAGLVVVDIAPDSVEAAEEALEAVAADVEAFFLSCDTLVQGGGVRWTRFFGQVAK